MRVNGEFVTEVEVEEKELPSDKVRHRTKPSEPFASDRAYGRITRTTTEVDEKGNLCGPLRITPKGRGIPAAAHVEWDSAIGVFTTWEKLLDLEVIK